MNSSNFGLPGDRKVIVLDSVIVINESMTLLKFRESKSCHPFGTNFQSLKASDLKLRTDTLLSHEVLNGSNTVAGARAYLEDHYNYFGSNSSPERIVLIGFKE
ncbi:MAG: hypothetical protein NWR73_08025 [Flavobacteriales bacterium]|nr:hypothetical protein [Flavobacteriales bacterium]